MSWLSSLFDSGPSSNEINAQAAARAQQQMAEDAARAQQQQQFDALMAGNQPTDYDKRLQQLQLQGLNDQAARDEIRRQASTGLSSIFAPEFERSLIGSTYDDPYINQAFTAQRGKADEYLNNLLKRGVINQTGYQGGLAAATGQEAGVRSQLQSLGDQLLEAERGKLTDVANRARGTASTLDIGQTFDPSIYQGELDTTVGDIGRDFGDLYTSSIPGDLFDLSALGQKAGAAQGGQNLAFDPAALSGNIQTDTGEEPPPEEKKRTTSVF